MADYPNSIVSLVNPTASHKLNSPSHSSIETSQNNEIIAIETELGIGIKGSKDDLADRLNVNIDSNGIIKRNIVQVDETYTVLSTDYIVLCDATSGNIIINLPSASTVEGYEFVIKKSDGTTKTVTVNGYNNETIDGDTSYIMASRYRFLKVLSDGSNWQCTGNN